MKHLLLFVALILLAGCLGEKKGIDSKTQRAVQGVAVIEEYFGSPYASKKSDVFALFAPASRTTDLDGRGVLRSQIRAGISDDDNGMKCDPIKSSLGDRATATSIGTVQFALSDKTGQTSAVYSMTESDHHVYQRDLNVEIPAGEHFVVSRGSDVSFAFQLPIWMPFELANATANTAPFLSSPAQTAAISKTQNIELEWDAPEKTDENIMLVNLITHQGDAKKVLQCGVLESKLTTTAGRIHWTVDKKYLPELYASAAELYLIREHDYGVGSKQGDQFEVIGDRVMGNFATVNE